MYNYLKNGVTLNAKVMDSINKFDEVARTLATESVDHTTTKKALEEKLAKFVEGNNNEKALETKKALEALEDAWTTRRKELDGMLFGSKDTNGNKLGGVCDLVTDDLYKAYTTFIKGGTAAKYRAELRKFCLEIINGDNLKDGAYNHLYNDIVQTMSSTRYNSNSQIAQGASFITTVNKRTYKKMLLGVICDIVANNRTLKVKKDKTAK